MGLIQKLLKGTSNKEEFKKKFKEAQQEDRINSTVEERKLNSNERELNRYIEEDRQEQIKSQLSKIRKQKEKEIWKSKNMILAGKATMLKTDRPILKEKNIFVDNRNDIPFVKKGGMFFK